MGKMIFTAMSDEDLEKARVETAGKIQSISGTIPVNGIEFSWEERADYNLRTENGELIMGKNSRLIISARGFDGSCETGTDGLIRRYSFFSSSGESEADAEETMRKYEVYRTLLSSDFRQMITRDYQMKRGDLNTLKEQYDAVAEEQYRRKNGAENERRAAAEKETAVRRTVLEAKGQVWYDYSLSSNSRYTVRSVTDKTITFDVRRFLENENRWVYYAPEYTKRVSKRLLGQKPSRRRRRGDKETAVCPVGTGDLNSQKPGQPEIVNY